jgi:DNA-directed RNA polymerase specialized sigma24 family protein
LSPSHRAVVVLKYWNELPLEEIAAVTGDSVGAVKVKLFRARQAMARALARQTQNGPVHLPQLAGVIGDAQ